jgi:hypothetical protein
VCLESLDLSYNIIKTIEGLDFLVSLKKTLSNIKQNTAKLKI